MAKKRRKVEVDIKDINGNTIVAGGSVNRTNQESVIAPDGDRFANVTYRAKNVIGGGIVAGGDVIDAVTFDTRLDELTQQLLSHYANDPEARGRITLLTEELAHEAQRPPAERDAGRAQRWLDGLQRFIIEAGAGAAGQMLSDTFRTYFLS